MAYALTISTWWIGPLIISRIKWSSRFDSFHVLRVIFWQIILTLLLVCGMILMSAAAFGAMASTPFPTALFVVIGVPLSHRLGGFVTSLTLGIIYGLQAMRGVWPGYPIIGR